MPNIKVFRKYSHAIGMGKCLSTLDTWNEKRSVSLYARRRRYITIGGTVYEFLMPNDKYVYSNGCLRKV